MELEKEMIDAGANTKIGQLNPMPCVKELTETEKRLIAIRIKNPDIMVREVAVIANVNESYASELLNRPHVKEVLAEASKSALQIAIEAQADAMRYIASVSRDKKIEHRHRLDAAKYITKNVLESKIDISGKIAHERAREIDTMSHEEKLQLHTKLLKGEQ